MRHPDGFWVTKGTVAEYLGELSALHERVDLVAPVGRWLPGIAGRLDGIRIIPEPETLPGLLAFQLRLAFTSRYDAALVYMPSGLRYTHLARRLKCRTRSLAVYLANDYREQVARRYGRLSRTAAGRQWILWANRHWLRTCDVALARGRSLAAEASKYARSAFETVPVSRLHLSMAAEPRCPPLAGEAIRLLYIGRVMEGKGLRQACRVVARLNADRALDREWIFEVAGDGNALEALRAETAGLVTSGQLRFHGWLDHSAALEDCWQRAHIALMPSDTHPEGVPRLLDEAMARGVPVVASAIGGVTGEFGPEEAELVQPGSEEGIRQGLLRVAGSAGHYRKLSKAGLRRARHWGQWGSAAHQHTEVLRQARRQENLKKTSR